MELTDNFSYSLLDVKGKVADIIVSTPSKGSPENCLLCVFGQANLAPTADDEISRLVLTPPAFNIYKSLLEKHTAFLIT